MRRSGAVEAEIDLRAFEAREQSGPADGRRRPLAGVRLREVADQVRSVGARWLSLGDKDVAAAGEGGYARELTDEERAQQQKALEDAIATAREKLQDLVDELRRRRSP